MIVARSILSFAVIVAGLFLPFSTRAAEGKFHLVYLVSVGKLETGADVLVEPQFFTDGKKLVFAYDYCRQYHERNGRPVNTFFKRRDIETLLPERIGDNLGPIHQYCDNQDVSIDLKGYVARDSAGTQLSLDVVKFTKHPRGLELPDHGIASIDSVDRSAQSVSGVKLLSQPQYFFLMAASKSLLDRIMPIRTVADHDKTRLMGRWGQYREDRLTGKSIVPHAGECSRLYPSTYNDRLDQRHMMRHGSYSTTSRPPLLNLIYAGIDVDDKPDLLIRMLETYGVVTGKHTSTFSVAVVRVFYGNGEEQCVLRSDGDPVSGGRAYGPLYLIQLGACRYLGTSLQTDASTVDFFSLPTESSVCKNRHAVKYDVR